jgi:hypothetical protein
LHRNDEDPANGGFLRLLREQCSSLGKTEVTTINNARL